MATVAHPMRPRTRRSRIRNINAMPKLRKIRPRTGSEWDLHHQGRSVGISTVDLLAKPAAHIDFGDQPTLSARGLINGLPLRESHSAWRGGVVIDGRRFSGFSQTSLIDYRGESCH